MRDSFLFYISFYNATQKMKDKERLLFYDALFTYAFEGVELDLSGRPNVEIAFIMAKPQLDANNKKYKNGAKGGRPKKEITGCEEEKPVVIEKENQWFSEKKPNDNENDNENEKDNDNVNDNDNENGTGYSTPLPLEKPVDKNSVFAEVYQAWERASGKCASIAQSEELQILLEEYGRENMLYAIKQGVNHNAVTLAYIKAVLKGNKSSGKRDKQEKSYIPNKQGKFADITDDLL